MLPWYQSYNSSKHDRHNQFVLANLDTVIDAICGLLVLLSAQFIDDRFTAASQFVGFGRYGALDNDGMTVAIGNFFRIKVPEWPEEERYELFDWGELERSGEPFRRFDYASADKAMRAADAKKKGIPDAT